MPVESGASLSLLPTLHWRLLFEMGSMWWHLFFFSVWGFSMSQRSAKLQSSRVLSLFCNYLPWKVGENK